MTALSLLPLRTPPARSIRSPQGHAHGLLVDAGPDHVPAHAEKPRAALTFCDRCAAKRSAPLRRINGTQASVSTLFTMVGHAKRPEMAGNGGLILGKPFPPSSEVEQRGLFAADIGSGSTVDDYVQVKAGPLDILAKPAVTPHRWRAASASPAGNIRRECRHRPYDCRWHRRR